MGSANSALSLPADAEPDTPEHRAWQVQRPRRPEKASPVGRPKALEKTKKPDNGPFQATFPSLTMRPKWKDS